MTTSNRLGITEMDATQNNRSVTVNEAIAKLEAGAAMFGAVSVLDNAPPGSPAEGDIYVVGTAGTGAFSGHNEAIAVYYNAAWFFLPPLPGMQAYAADEDAFYYYDVGGTWVLVSTSGGVGDVVGPASATDGRFAAFDGPTGKLIKELTATQATAFLNAMVGDSGAGGTKGLAPAPAAGDAAAGKFLKADGTYAVPTVGANPTESLIIAVGDETTAITTGTAKVTFRMPYAFTLSAVRASLTTVSSSGTPTVDINENGTTILSTKLTIDASEKTSTTAATPAVISDTSLADDAEMTIDIDVAGTGAAGLKVYLIGSRT